MCRCTNHKMFCCFKPTNSILSEKVFSRQNTPDKIIIKKNIPTSNILIVNEMLCDVTKLPMIIAIQNPVLPIELKKEIILRHALDTNMNKSDKDGLIILSERGLINEKIMPMMKTIQNTCIPCDVKNDIISQYAMDVGMNSVNEAGLRIFAEKGAGAMFTYMRETSGNDISRMYAMYH